MRIELVLNGVPYAAEAKQNQTLLDFLREQGLSSVKRACGTVCCGVCTVWVDEKPVPSCACLAVRMSGRRVTTIEGISREAEVLTTCLAEEGAEQCGFCSPGLVMTILAMNRERPKIRTENEVCEYLAGNLCRCTGYVSQLRAILRYLEKTDSACD